MLIIDARCLLERRAMAAQMPAALAAALAKQEGGAASDWQAAYERIVADWTSYWADLDIGGDESLAHWREGRWRVMRAHFRLAGRNLPPLAELGFYLDGFPRAVGQRIEAWQGGALAALHQLAACGSAVALVSPYLAASLLRGMLDAAGLADAIRAVLGPDELGQAGLDGLAWAHITRLAGASPDEATWLSDEPLPGAQTIAPPADLTRLPDSLNINTLE